MRCRAMTSVLVLAKFLWKQAQWREKSVHSIRLQQSPSLVETESTNLHLSDSCLAHQFQGPDGLPGAAVNRTVQATTTTIISNTRTTKRTISATNTIRVASTGTIKTKTITDTLFGISIADSQVIHNLHRAKTTEHP